MGDTSADPGGATAATTTAAAGSGPSAARALTAAPREAGDPGALRRVEGRRSNVAHYGELRIDYGARRVLRGEQEVSLTAFEYNTLAYLAHRAGEVVSRTELLEHLYDHDADRDSNVIEVFVGRLRRKLDPQGELHPIETVRGAGYRFTPRRTSA